ncbi:MAG: S-methyl-5-thioribose-1-phosphate isomerase [Candidatus Bathyarchaeota archaeon]|nr:S-methyl-5-thioribose-1-phosphate isomerase [Candidatus Termitimicrobium sp.]MCL2686278.1 S-methyl-5-thioribose-1-phosphate isomerase [Candidatus Termitimicrobium sp.]
MRMIKWQNGTVLTPDQTQLPLQEVTLEIKTVEQMAEAIKTLRIRGAPLLGAAAGFGLALAAYNSQAKTPTQLITELEEAGMVIKQQRPTAVNLFWGVDRVLNKVKSTPGTLEELKAATILEAQLIADEDAAQNRAIGKNGSVLIDDGDTILTHCNAGELATVEYGTALGVIRAAWEAGKKIKVIADETRPLLQGARLTVYELKRDGIPVTLITDNMAAHIMKKGLVNKVIVGADRIVQDAVFNKIGTYGVAVLAHEHNIPFYVAAPKSTFDLTSKADDITIEERNPNEVTHVGCQQTAPNNIDVYNPAFDATPLKYVSAIICETQIYYPQDYQTFRTKKPDP